MSPERGQMQRRSSIPSTRRALTLVASAVIPFVAAHGQKRDPREKPDTTTTRVILVPVMSTAVAPELDRMINGRTLVGIYTTDGAGAARLAARLQADLGSTIVTRERGGKTAEDFAALLVAAAVDTAARRQMNRAVIVVVEPDVFRPFLRRAAGERSAASLDKDIKGLQPVTIFVSPGDAADGRRIAVHMRPPA
jgi:hypothetical protein